jgi:hypothetical protein
MRMKSPLLVLLLGVAWPLVSHAEKVRTNASAKVYNRAGEQGKVVVKVKEGQSMTVLAKEGRWLKVRVSGRTGYIPRSKVDMPDGDDEIARNTRRRPFVDGRGTKRGFGGEAGPDDRIGADATGDSGGSDDASDSSDDSSDDSSEPAKPKGKGKGKGKGKAKPEVVEDDSESDEPKDAEEAEPDDSRVRARVKSKTVAYAEPSKDSDEQFKAKPGDVLFVESKKGKWTEVSVEEGDIGWIQTSKLEMDDDGGDGPGGAHGRIMDVRARLGFTIVSQSMTSAGAAATTKWPDKYTVGSSSVAVMLGGALLYPYGKNYLVGGELTYDLSKAVPGVSFDPDGAAGPMVSSTTGFTIHNVNARAVGGYDLHKKNGAMLFGRLTYHYEAFRVDNVADLTKNSARLPQENMSGPMIGAALAVPALTDKLGLRVSLDAMLVGGSITQTKNLEDGADPKVKKIVLGAGVTYRWKPGIDLSGGYDLNYASLKFGAPPANSMRGHGGTSSARTDVNHTVAVGIAKAF